MAEEKEKKPAKVGPKATAAMTKDEPKKEKPAKAPEKKSEKKDEFASQNLKFEFLPARENPVLMAPASFQLLPQLNSFAESFPQKPQTPPPRGLLA